MYNILKLNEISSVANDCFSDNYSLSKDCKNPDAIILRSYNMHDYEIPSSVTCVARAGAGTNNIPIQKCSENGIVVFNTPGANANAVKELALLGLLISSRKVTAGINWAQNLKGTGVDVAKTVESGKNAFVGPELYGKKLGVVGLGAIGVMLANSAYRLGMEVIGYDPFISVDGAWKLDRHVSKETNLDALLSKCDYISLHVPLNDSTRALINNESLKKCKDGVRILNFARGELVDNAAVIAGTESGKVACYVTDFPCEELLGYENIITIPHLGASSPEAEDNCAVMASKQLVDFLENGNIVNSVNLPSCSLTRQGVARFTVIHRNVKNVLNSITSLISSENVNIGNFISQSKGDYAYTIIETDSVVSQETIDKLQKLENVIKVRVL